MTSHTRLYGSIFVILSFLAGWALFFHYYPINRLISDFGITNMYVAAFVLAVIGGFSSLTGISLYAALIVLARGGVNPYILGTVAGLGIFISDSLFYAVAFRMRSFVIDSNGRFNRLFKHMWRWVYKTPSWLVFFFVYLYSAFAPIPNDILLAVLALSGYEYKEFAPFLFLGDITGMILLTTVAAASAM